MEIQSTIFDNIIPWSESVIYVNNPGGTPVLSTPRLRVTILDSGHARPEIACVLLVPEGREHDFLFTTPAGYKQLREEFYNVSRLFPIANDTPMDLKSVFKVSSPLENQSVSERKKIEGVVMSVLRHYLPASLRTPVEGKSDVVSLFMNYFDNIENRVCVAASAGDFIVYDEVTRSGDKFVCTRRLRFHISGDLVHTESTIQTIDTDSKNVVKVDPSHPE